MITDYKLFAKIVKMSRAGDSEFAISCKLDILQFRIQQVLDSHKKDEKWNKPKIKAIAA